MNTLNLITDTWPSPFSAGQTEAQWSYRAGIFGSGLECWVPSLWGVRLLMHKGGLNIVSCLSSCAPPAQRKNTWQQESDIPTASFSLLFLSCGDTQSLAHCSVCWPLWFQMTDWICQCASQPPGKRYSVFNGWIKSPPIVDWGRPKRVMRNRSELQGAKNVASAAKI